MEQSGGGGDVGAGVLDVARAGGLVVGFKRTAQYLRQLFNNLLQRCALTAADIEGTASDAARGGGGAKVGFHDIVDENEVAGLLAVAVNGRLPALGDRRDELRNDGGVGPVRVLAGAVNVKVAQRDGLQAVQPEKVAAKVLGGQLR